MKILLIEDNVTIAKQIVEFLEAHNWQTDFAANGRQGTELAIQQAYDVILLDLNLPDLDGIEVCRQIKQKASSNVPILMVTARDSFEDKAEGFETGADDYLTKPFDMRELVLRCQALARRHQLHQSQLVTIGELGIDNASKQVTRQGQPISVTKVGFQILSLLAEAHPNPVSKQQLHLKIWSDQMPESDPLKSHIYSLRKALDKPFEFEMLKTVKDVGYKLEVSNEAH